MKTRSGSMKTIVLGILVLGIAWKGSIYLLSSPSQTQETHEKASSAQPDPSQAAQNSQLAQTAKPAESAKAPVHKPEPIVSEKDAPTTQRVREQVAVNPHGTPPILIDFASRMAEVMEDAAKSPENARQAAAKLKECVSGSESNLIESARAMCLFNLARLAQSDSQIAKEYESAVSGASPRVALIARATATMGRR